MPRPRPVRAAALGLLLTGTAAALAGCGGGSDAQAAVVARIDVEPHVGPDIKADGRGSVWALASDTFAGTEVPYAEAQHLVVRIDAEAEEVTARVAVPHPMAALAIGEGAVWATGTDFGPQTEQPSGSVVRIDPATDTVTGSAEFPAPAAPSDVAVGFGSVWVADARADTVYRVDPTSLEVVAQIAIDGGPASLAVTATAVWVTKPASGEIRPIDPDTNTPLPTVSLGPVPDVLEAGGAGLWVARYGPALLERIDEEGRTVAQAVEFPSAPSRLAVGDDLVVVAETENETLSVVRNGSRRPVLDGRRIVAVTIDRGTVWAVALNGGPGRVLHISLPPA